jgi:hypothetical protein
MYYHLFPYFGFSESIFISIVGLETLEGQMFFVLNLELTEQTLQLIVIQLQPAGQLN